MREFKVGDKVMIRKDSKWYGRHELNPADTIGSVIEIESTGTLNIRVQWSQGTNSYSNEDLELVRSSFADSKEEIMDKCGITRSEVLRKDCISYVIGGNRAVHVNPLPEESHIQVSLSCGGSNYQLTSKENLDSFIAALMLIREELK